MRSSDYKVLITTSGTGSRLGELTHDTNKVLVPIAGKPGIDYIFNCYPKDTRFVLTLGYLGGQVKEYVQDNYSDKNIEFVEVDNYEGHGSSLGYSMLRAKDSLRCPFIFHACDTLVTQEIPAPDRNWIAGFMVNKNNTDLNLNQYRTHRVENGKIIRLNDKGVSDFESIHIGLIGIYDYQVFWQTLENIYQSDRENSSWSDVHVLDRMIKDGFSFELIPYDVWLDTGNLESLEKTKLYLLKHK